MSGPEMAPVRPTKLSATIPPLRNLVYEQCGYNVPATFSEDFVELHEDDWGRAERDWERIVARVLDTDSVEPRASGGSAIKQAVESAAAFLMDKDAWPWCPICHRPAAERKDDVDER